jgi:hypothetical protein
MQVAVVPGDEVRLHATWSLAGLPYRAWLQAKRHNHAKSNLGTKPGIAILVKTGSTDVDISRFEFTVAVLSLLLRC